MLAPSVGTSTGRPSRRPHAIRPLRLSTAARTALPVATASQSSGPRTHCRGRPWATCSCDACARSSRKIPVRLSRQPAGRGRRCLPESLRTICAVPSRHGTSPVPCSQHCRHPDRRCHCRTERARATRVGANCCANPLGAANADRVGRRPAAAVDVVAHGPTTHWGRATEIPTTAQEEADSPTSDAVPEPRQDEELPSRAHRQRYQQSCGGRLPMCTSARHLSTRAPAR